MIFTEIILHNFGIYKGRHIIDLTPTSEKKPIILFGGLNGGGKTTFLDALQLTLYGKFAKCSNRGELTYSDFLNDAINNYASKKEGAALELEFIHFTEGTKTTYRIKRLWRSTGKNIKETVEVLKNGQKDPVISEHWYEYVDEFIPSNISGLFFFDGEQIENLANPDTSSEIIQTGIMSLLGLDLVDKLQNDLRTIERRRLARYADNKTSKVIHNFEDHIKELQNKKKQESDSLASKKTEIDSIKRQINNAKKSYKNHGGELFEQRELIENQHSHNQALFKNTEKEIRKFAAADAPLLLVKELIKKAQKQAKKERNSLLNRDVIKTLEDRDLEILAKFSKNSNNEKSFDLLNDLLTNDRNIRYQSAQQNTPLNMRIEAIEHFNNTFITQLSNEKKLLLENYEYLSNELSISDRQLSSVPEADMIRDVAKQLNLAVNNLNIAQGELNSLQNLHTETDKLLNYKQDELSRLLHNVNDEQLNAHRNKRIIEHASDIRNTLSIYRKKLIKKHIGRLESLIEESFKSLVRKSDLVSHIVINPDNFSLHIMSKQNEIIPAKRLSAGERQLLAISILWGLAKASGRPLPAIIDTPLGRLDSEHRGHLVDNYFPNASHQVILLSTDTEIDNKHRNDLSKRIGKEYHIQYHEDLMSSTITPGYF